MVLKIKDVSDEELKSLNDFVNDITILRLAVDSSSEIDNCETLESLTNILPFNRIKNILSFLYDNTEAITSIINNNGNHTMSSLSNTSWLEFDDDGNVYLLKNGDQVDIIEKIKAPVGDFYFGFYYSINLADYSKTLFTDQISEYIETQNEKEKPITEDTAFILAIVDTLLPEDAISVIVNDDEKVVDQWIEAWKLIARDY